MVKVTVGNNRAFKSVRLIKDEVNSLILYAERLDDEGFVGKSEIHQEEGDPPWQIRFADGSIIYLHGLTFDVFEYAVRISVVGALIVLCSKDATELGPLLWENPNG